MSRLQLDSGILKDWKQEHPWFRLEEFHGGNTPGDTFMYYNRRGRDVGEDAGDWLVTGSIPDDPELAG